jgi:hypothetical protein
VGKDNATNTAANINVFFTDFPVTEQQYYRVYNAAVSTLPPLETAVKMRVLATGCKRLQRPRSRSVSHCQR